ncbi:dihydrolipoyl dehydrogenase [Cupriavidus respiraculi]|uniref:dihydrolipoyl dehydrogenase n=1 Tax=Cupriavidus respiraculi TaxID=195930 RepID=UPI001C943EF9|nr:dihydrolipoyl dehydrogenase [Cupriavidus respiraculi]MBY4946811.1 dihydrolipoyl dehydrogenase [Cupriavidus respiraculi]
MSKQFDVLVIGAGPGGYIAAIRAGQLGLNVACCEDNPYDDPKGEPRLGGTCLNVGCIPSKALLASSEEYENVQHHLGAHGITVGDVKVDIAKMLKRKDDIVGKMTKGIEFLFRKNKVTLLKGHGSFVGKNADGFQVEVAGKDGTEVVTAKQVIIATGSKARHLPGIPVDNVLIADNEGALKFAEVPKKLGVIGAGVIGLELGSVWRRLGADVTVLEALPTFLGAADEGVAKEGQKLLTKQGLKFNFGVKVNEVKTGKNNVTVSYTDKDGAAQTLEVDRLIVSVGRVPNTDKLGLDKVGLGTDERGFIPVDDHCATSVPGLWAIGDVVRGPMLAHKAEDEGVAVAERIVGQKPHIDYNCVPWVIYTYPEIAWVGKTEQQLKAEGREYKSGQFPFMANGRALGMGASDGFVKMLADAKTDEILGVHIVAANASDLVAEAVVAMEFKAASEDIGRVCHPHPSMSEVMREAALAVDKRQLNM